MKHSDNIRWWLRIRCVCANFFFLINLNFDTAVDVNNCLEQIELHNFVHSCAPYSKGSRKKVLFLMVRPLRDGWGPDH